MTVAPTRLPAAERRRAVVDAALGAFVARSYRGATTAEIAREAGVSEPILYRHFPSKRELFLACVDEAWRGLRELWERAIEERPDEPLAAMGQCYLEIKERKLLLAELWIQGVDEATDDPEIERRLRAHVREVHDFVAGKIRAAQASGAVPAERDPEAEAWVFVAMALLAGVGRRLGGLVQPEDYARIRTSRLEWMSGVSAALPDSLRQS
jgi:AcrR family transcriptional regulator